MLTAGTQCIINIECRQPGKSPDEPAKIIQTFRAIDTGTEIKLVPADLPVKVTNASLSNKKPDESNTSVSTSPLEKSKANSSNTSYCKICNKCITNKNMGRHLEKHQKKEQELLGG